MKFPLGAMTVGDILDRGLKVLFARLPAFYAIHLLVLSPYLLIQTLGPIALGADARDFREFSLLNSLITLAGLFVLLACQPIAMAATLHIIMEEYVGNRVTMGQALAFALTRFLSLLGASLLVGLIVGAGCLLCCIPGIYLFVTYVFVGQVVVLERLGAGDALQRSQSLVTGHRWRVFGVLVLVYLGNAVVQTTARAGFR
jgi:hypothetical protein